MKSNDDVFRMDRTEQGKNAQRYPKKRSVLDAYGVKTAIIESGGACSFGNRAVQGSDRKYITHTSPEFSAQIQGRKCAALFGQMGRRRIEAKIAPMERAFNRIVR